MREIFARMRSGRWSVGQENIHGTTTTQFLERQGWSQF